MQAFDDAAIPAILLKGPTLVRWLYDDGVARFYMDSDLWVEPGQFARAEKVLSDLGFVRRPSPVPPEGRVQPHAEPWTRSADGAEVDLHRTLSGVGVAPETAWQRLWPATTRMDVGGRSVAVLPFRAQALLVVLHAAQHGPEKAKPLADLGRAVARVTPDEWRDVAMLAANLDATPGFASGLRLLPEGAEVAERLGLVSSELIESATRSDSAARIALGFHRVAEARTTRERLGLIMREAFPAPAFMRWWSPLARRGRLGLAVAYVWRASWLLWHAGPSLVAWRRERQRRR